MQQLLAPLFLVPDNQSHLIKSVKLVQNAPDPFQSSIQTSSLLFSVFFWIDEHLLDNTRPPAQPFPQDFCDLQQHCVLMPASPGVIVVGQLLSPTYRSLSDGFVYFFPTKADNASKTLNQEYLICHLILLTNARLQIFLSNIQHSI